MKQNRAYRVVIALHNAPNRTRTLFELEKDLGTDWSPRAISEARKNILGVVIKGHNPYTLVSWPETMFRTYQFNQETGMYRQI